jgi:hypothetical protein
MTYKHFLVSSGFHLVHYIICDIILKKDIFLSFYSKKMHAPCKKLVRRICTYPGKTFKLPVYGSVLRDPADKKLRLYSKKNMVYGNPMPELTHLISLSTLLSAIHTTPEGKGWSEEDLSYWLSTSVYVC